MRLFVAIDPGEAVVASVAAAAARARAAAPRAKWAARERLHVTLAFLGEVDDALVPAIEAALRAVGEASAPLALRFDGAGTFGSPAHPRILWVGVGGDLEALGALEARVAAALAPHGYVREDRAFAPHLTLARARAPRGDAALADAARAIEHDEHGDARCDALALYRSDPGPGGARYTVIARAPLTAT